MTGVGGLGGPASLCGGGGAGAGGLGSGGGGAGGGGCFDLPAVQNLGSGQVVAFAGVARNSSSVQVKVLANLPRAAKSRRSRLVLIGQVSRRGLRPGRVKLVVRLSTTARRRFRRVRRTNVVVRMWLSAPRSRTLYASRNVTLKR